MLSWLSPWSSATTDGAHPPFGRNSSAPLLTASLIVFAGGRYGRARGAKYDRVQTEEEGRSLVDDDLGDFDVEGDVAPVQRDRRGNPVAKAIVSEGPCATAASVLVLPL